MPRFLTCLTMFVCSVGYGPAVSASFDLDIDDDGKTEALTDGLLVIRHLFGFSGDSLTANATGSDAQRSDAASIESHLVTNKSWLDVDGDEAVMALTDGLLIIRELFGFSGDSLISGAVSSSGTRQTASTVIDYLKAIKDSDNDGVADSLDPFPMDQFDGLTALSETSWSCEDDAVGPTGSFKLSTTELEITLATENIENDLKLQVGLACSPETGESYTPNECQNQGYELLEKQRLTPTNVAGDNVTFNLTAPSHKRFQLKLEAIYKTCTATLSETFQYSQGFLDDDAFLVPDSITINKERYTNFDLPQPGLAPLILAGSRALEGTGYNDPPAWSSMWQLIQDRGRLFEGENKLKLGLFGDLKEIHWQLGVEMIELLNKIAPDLEAGFAATYGEITMPIFIQVCENWEQNSFLSKCQNRPQGELSGGPPSLYIWVDVYGYQNPGYYGNFPTIRHEIGHSLGLQHHLCTGGQMPVNSQRPQTPSFSLKELAMIALMHNERFPMGDGKSFSEVREAFGIADDETLQSYLNDPDLACSDGAYDSAWSPLWEEYQKNVVIDNGTPLKDQ